MKSAGLSACFKEEGVITKKISMPRSPTCSEVAKNFSHLISWMLGWRQVKELCSLETGWSNTCQKHHYSNTSLYLHSKNQLLPFLKLGLCVSYKRWPLWCSAEEVPSVPCPPSTHTEELPIPACICLIPPGGQMSWLETFILISLWFSTKPPRSCNSPYKPTIIEEVFSYRQAGWGTEIPPLQHT